MYIQNFLRGAQGGDEWLQAGVAQARRDQAIILLSHAALGGLSLYYRAVKPLLYRSTAVQHGTWPLWLRCACSPVLSTVLQSAAHTINVLQTT